MSFSFIGARRRVPSVPKGMLLRAACQWRPVRRRQRGLLRSMRGTPARRAALRWRKSSSARSTHQENCRRLSSAAGKTTRHLTAIIRRRPTSALSTKKEFSSATAISIAPKSSRFFPLAMGFPTPLFNTAVCPYHRLLPI